ncbi:MAG: hypothetical protein QOE44_2787 [Solirubrobacteraceae bacterium]|jgi:hypothetical protein|nr:hypothetical protein [Solirubrobacteraceae bacterium]
MRIRFGRPVGIVIGLAAALAACDAKAPPPAPGCAAGSAALERALASAPAAVRLPGGTPISACVDHARTAGQLLAVGSLLTGTADRLAVRAVRTPAAALELGYLVGATRRGAGHTNGIASELQRRIESAAALREAVPASLDALHRGIGAGERSG